jgi:hypothetical protein
MEYILTFVGQHLPGVDGLQYLLGGLHCARRTMMGSRFVRTRPTIIWAESVPEAMSMESFQTNREQTVPQGPIILDSQYQQADAALQQRNVGEEQDLR